MIASAIAYFVTALFFTIGIFAFYRVGSDKAPADKENAYLLVGAVHGLGLRLAGRHLI